MIISERAKKYLNSLERSNKWVSDKENMIEYFKKQNLPVNETLIAIQTDISGYKLTVTGKHEHYFLLNLFSKDDIKRNKPIKKWHFENTYLLNLANTNLPNLIFILPSLESFAHGDIETKISQIFSAHLLKNLLNNMLYKTSLPAKKKVNTTTM